MRHRKHHLRPMSTATRRHWIFTWKIATARHLAGGLLIGAALATVAAALIASSVPVLADWNVAVGGTPTRSGFVGTVGPTQATRLWDGVRFTRYVRPIAVADGRVFASWNQASSAFNEVVAFDLETGTELWSVELPTAGADPSSERSRVSGVRDGQVYATRAAGRTNPLPMHALDAADGTIIWTSVAGTTESSGQSLTFTPDGDLICQGGPIGAEGLYRIDHTDGSTVWFVPCIPQVDDSNGAVVFDSRVYAWNMAGGLRVSAFDLDTGTLLYHSATLPAYGPLTQQGLFVGLDGTVYAPRSGSPTVQNGLFALEDTGSALVTRWSFPLGFGVFSTHGVGADGSIHTHDRDGRLVRLDPADGAVIDSSLDPIPGAAATDFSPRLAVDAAGNVFVGNGSYGSGAIIAYDSELDVMWTETLGTQSITGPALTDGGELVVQTRFDGMIVYRTQASGMGEELAVGPAGLRLSLGYPNPFRARTTLSYLLPQSAGVRLAIYHASGRQVATLIDREQVAGTHELSWDGRDDRGQVVASGVYFARLQSRGVVQTRKLKLTR